MLFTVDAQHLDDVRFQITAQSSADGLSLFIDVPDQGFDLLVCACVRFHDGGLPYDSILRLRGLVTGSYGLLLNKPLLADATAGELTLTQVAANLLNGAAQPTRGLRDSNHPIRYCVVVVHNNIIMEGTGLVKPGLEVRVCPR